jgi:hypothetical protein
MEPWVFTRSITSYTVGRFCLKVRCWAQSLELVWIRTEVSLFFIGQDALGQNPTYLN